MVGKREEELLIPLRKVKKTERVLLIPNEEASLILSWKDREEIVTDLLGGGGAGKREGATNLLGDGRKDRGSN